jgi:threonyl-tRNA synthetase
MIGQAYAALGIDPVRYRLSLPGPGSKYAGTPEAWERATAMLTEILASSGLAYEVGEGEAAFYGPKIDVQVADSSEREAPLCSVQVDFYQPGQFDLHYIGADGARHRPVLVHRSIIGNREAAAGQVAIRLRDGRLLPPLPAVAALTGIAAHVAAHRTELWDAAA